MNHFLPLFTASGAHAARPCQRRLHASAILGLCSSASLSSPRGHVALSPFLFSFLELETSRAKRSAVDVVPTAPRRPSIFPRPQSRFASPQSSSAHPRAQPRPTPAEIDTSYHRHPLKFRRNSGRRRTPPPGHRFHQPTAEIDSPRLPKAHALLVLGRSHCFHARSPAMPSPACCCSSRAARMRPCAAPPSTPSPPGSVEHSRGRPITNLPRRRRGRRRHRRSFCCTTDAPPPTIPGSNSCFYPALGEPLVLPHHSPTVGTAFPHRNRAP